jgi:hypothetical protein
MSRNSQLPNDAEISEPCARDKTQVIPIEPLMAATPRSVTQVLPVRCEPSSPTPAQIGRQSQRSQGQTLILSLPNAQSSHELGSSGSAAAESCETASGRSQHTLVWPDHISAANAGEASDTADTSDVGASAEPCGPVTRVVRPSEWLPSAALAAIPASQARALPACPTPDVDTLIRDASCEQPSSGSATSFAAIKHFSALSPRRKALLALAPLAVFATVYALNTQRVRQPTTARHTQAAKRLSPEAPLMAKTATPAELTPAAPASLAGAGATRNRSQKTLLRQAADSIAEGNYANARALCAQLQASDPQNPAYGAALRIIDRQLAKPR